MNSSQSGETGDNSKKFDTAKDNTKNSPLFGNFSSPTKFSSNSKNIFSATSSLDLPSTANNPPPNGMFPPLSQSAPIETPNPNNSPQKDKMSEPPQDPKALEKCQKDIDTIVKKPDSDFELPAELQDMLKTDPMAANKFVAGRRLRDLNLAVGVMWTKTPWHMDPAPLLKHYMNQRVEILTAAGLYGGIGKRKDREDDVDPRAQKRSNTQSIAQTQPVATATASELATENNNNRAPASGFSSHVGTTSTEPQPQGSVSLTNGTTHLEAPQMSSVAGSPSKKASFTPLPTEKKVVESLRNAQEAAPSPNPSSSKGKRKAEDELTQDTEQVNPLRAVKAQKLNGASTATEGSNTSALFSSILNSPAKSKDSAEKTPVAEKPRLNPFDKLPIPASPSKDVAEKTITADKPRINPFGNLPVPQSQTNTAAPSSPTRSHAFNPAASSSSNMFSIKGAASASSSNMFATKDTYNATKPSPFGTSSASTSTPASSNLFSPAKGTTIAQTDASPSKSASAPVANPFQLKPTTQQNTTTAANPFQVKSSRVTGAANGPPKFGNTSGLSAMEQFREKAKQDEEAKEKKQMEKDKDNEWDSEDEDETESDYERKWYARRAEQKMQLEKDTEALKTSGPKFTFKPSQDTLKTGAEDTAKTATTSLFAPSTSGQASGHSVTNSINGSRTSTPGPFGSAAGSVIGGSGPSQPTQNIFGHLSGTDSGRGEEDDESDDADDEDDTENKDPNYVPGAENHSSPGTPAEETGAGIASAKKPLFNFSSGALFDAASTSGTSTPGRSLFDRIGPKPVAENPEEEKPAASPMTGGLFDRISKDSNGNPLRSISSDEKENTQPSSTDLFKTSPFASSLFSKSSATPADQTWKQDSPIKFGASTAPSVSVTAATPTKTPTNLFGSFTGASSGSLFNSSSSKPATPSLFPGLLGSNGTNGKPAPSSVGFAFGAAQSTSSSLFPSVVGSAATSRGTSPGATTDGTSDADADPDEVHHPQIDLTSGGQGEENEEVVYEVRAKALSWDTDGSTWNTLGVGPLRVLKHKETGVARVLLRADPSGKIVLNNGILNLPYKVDGKTVKFVAANGGELESYVLQVKTPESAQKLADVLTENKAK